MIDIPKNESVVRVLKTTNVDILCVAGQVHARRANVGLGEPAENTCLLANWCVLAMLCLGLWTLEAEAQVLHPLLVHPPLVGEGAIQSRISPLLTTVERAREELINAPTTDPQNEALVEPLLEPQVDDLALKLYQRHQFNGARGPDKDNSFYNNPEGWFDPLKTWSAQLATGWPRPGDDRIKDCASSDPSPYGFLAGDNLQNGALPADITGVQPLTLEQFVDSALCRNPQVRSSWAAVKVQAASLGEAKAAYLPTFSMGVGAAQDKTRYSDSPLGSSVEKGNMFNASLTWRLWDMGTRAANQNSAQQLLNAALFSHDAILQKLLSNVVTAYFDTQTTQAAWAARLQTEELLQKTLDISKQRQVRGVESLSDTLHAATALAKARMERSRAKGAYDKARSILVNVTGLSYGTSIVVQESPDASSAMATQRMAVKLKTEIGEWLERAMNHPSLQEARSQVAAAHDKIQAARSDGAPTLDFSIRYNRNGRPDQGLSGTKSQQMLTNVTLNIPVFEGFGKTYKVRGAQALAEQRSAELQESEGQVLMEVVKAHAEALAALDNLDASQDLQRWAEDAAASVQRRYDRGVSDILEMISAQTSLADSRQERIRCLAEWQSARLRLLASAGALGRPKAGIR
jgi:outer membrane protein